MTKIKEPKLTLKQSAFLEKYYNPDSDTYGNGTASALAVYDTDNYPSASQIAYENLRKLEHRKEILMEQAGLGLVPLFKTTKEGLSADRVISSISGKQASGATQDFIEVPDHATRHKFVSTVGKWWGLENKRKEEFGIKTKDIEIVFRRS